MLIVLKCVQKLNQNHLDGSDLQINTKHLCIYQRHHYSCLGLWLVLFGIPGTDECQNERLQLKV